MIPYFMILLILLLLFVLSASYYAYRLAFFAPKRDFQILYRLPKGPQYEATNARVEEMIREFLALPCEDVIICASDGTRLFGRYYHTNDHAPVQILFHGYKSTAFLDFCGGIKLVRKLGHNVLVVDQRAHGHSEGRTISFGILECKDCLDWISYVNQRFENSVPILLSGLSMGAATVLMASDLNLPSNVVGIIADCPYDSPRSIIQKVGRDMHFPPKLMYPFVRFGALIYGHFHLEETSPIKAVQHAKIPILLFHGDDDRFVPHEMSKAIAAACPKELITFQTIHGAGHGLCFLTEPETYQKTYMDFLKKIGL